MLPAKARSTGLLCVVLMCATAERGVSKPVENPGGDAHSQFGRLPMSFEPNHGQVNPPAVFLARGQGYALFLMPAEATFVFRTPADAGGSHHKIAAMHGRRGRDRAGDFSQTILRMMLVGANRNPQIDGTERLPGVASYFFGSNPGDWRVGIPTFGKVIYRGVYPGIDLQFYGNQQQLEYDFVVQPGADPAVICIRFDGADRLETGPDGELNVHINNRQIHWRRPVSYQRTADGVRGVDSSYVLADRNMVRFALGPYDKSLPLVIDPVLVYSTYFGGSDTDAGVGVAVDSAGNVYITGETLSANLPVTNAYRATPHGGTDVFVAKLNSTGSALLYSTYLGGTTNDVPTGIAVDSAGNAYVVGWTESTNFPTRNAYQGTFSRFTCAFVSKLGPAGTNLLYSSYLGNTSNAGDELGNAICVDGAGNAYIAGVTYSGRYFRTKNPFQAKAGGFPNDNNADAFVAKFNTAATGDASLVYSSWLGGSSDEFATGIAVDASANVYVTGEVDSNTPWPSPPTSDFPTTPGAFQPRFNAGGTNGMADAFVTKINAAGSALVFSTFLGGDGEEAGNAIAVDATGKVYVVGETSSYTDFPVTPNAAQRFAKGYHYQAFVTVFHSSGSNLLYSTYLGGSAGEFGRGIAVDSFGAIYITGEAGSTDFPVTVGADQTNRAGITGTDVFVAKINPNTFGPASLVYASYFGGTDFDWPAAIAVDALGNWFVAGTSSSTNLPTTAGAFRPTYRGGESDAFVAKFSSPADLSVAMLASINTPPVGSNFTYTLYVNNNGRVQFSGVTVRDLLPTNLQFVTASTTMGNWTHSNRLVTFNLGVLTNNASATLTITALAVTPGTVTNTATLSAVESELNTANNVASVLTAVRGIADVTLALSAAPNPVIASSNLTYTCGITNKGPWPATGLLLTNRLAEGVNFVSATVLPAGSCTNFGGYVVCGMPSLPVGGGAMATIVVTPVPAGLTITNTANVAVFDLDPFPANDTASVVTTVTPLADLGISAIVGTPEPVFAGSNLTYVVSVTNLGPSTATGLVVSNRVPAGLTFVPALSSPDCVETGGAVTRALTNLAKNTGATVTIVYRTGAQGIVTNSVHVLATAPTLDLTPGNNSGSAVNTVLASADLAVGLVAHPNPVMVASNLTYTITVSNLGPTAATGVVLTNQLPTDVLLVSAQVSKGVFELVGGGVTWQLGALDAHTEAAADIVVKPTLEGPLRNAAGVSSGVTDPVGGNNIAVITNTVIYNPNAVYLKIARAGTNVLLYWSTNAWDYFLQSATNLDAGSSWATLTNVPARVGRLFYVTNAPASGLRVYRLNKGL